MVTCSGSNSKRILIILCPFCLLTIVLLNKNHLNVVLSAVRNPFSQKDLVFIAHSTIEINSNMSDKDTDIAFIKYISKRHFACENSIRLGHILDGGWDMCIAEPYRPKQPCLVYSFGINYDFSFDDAVSKEFNCTVRSFDPSMKNLDHRRSLNVWFYKLGIGGDNTVNNKKWALKTLPEIINSLNDTDVVIDYLKMDVEGSEWSSLEPILSSGVLSKVKQFGIEIHTGTAGLTAKALHEKYLLLKRLEDAGFRRWYFANNYYNMHKTPNGFRSCCYEMVYINKGFLETK